jgi:hypothetical protein
MRYRPGKGRLSVQQEPSAGGGSSSTNSGSSGSTSADGNTYAHLLGRVTTVLRFVHEQVCAMIATAIVVRNYCTTNDDSTDGSSSSSGS